MLLVFTRPLAIPRRSTDHIRQPVEAQLKPSVPREPVAPEQRLIEVRSELEQRLERGERLVCEALFASDPELAADDETALELIYCEFAALERLGEHPEPEEFYRRFPTLRDRLTLVLRIHTLLDHDGSDDESGDENERDGWPFLCENQTAHDSDSRTAESHRSMGKYQVLEEIGRGGMGIVFKARQRGLGRIVALKMIRSPMATREELIAISPRSGNDCEAGASAYCCDARYRSGPGVSAFFA